MRAFKHISFLSFIAALSGVASADIKYTVQLSPDNKQFLVTIDVPTQKGKDLTLQMPRWSPGGYDYGDFGKQVNDFAAKDSKGNALTFDHPDFSTWHLANSPAGDVVVSYTTNGDFSNDVMQISGPSTYMYVVGRKQEHCQVTVNVPSDWPLATGLLNAGNSRNVFVAGTYDILADNPISSGHYYADSYTIAGKQHYIALRGLPEDVAAIDKAKLHHVTSYISSMESNFWGGEPYDHYVWHFVAFKRADGGWGLEHLASTQIGLATGFGKNTDSVMAHELFHAWNVKRIRSKPLRPFDYQTLPKTGALWWLEGVTDYYADTLLRRYNWTDDQRYEFVIARNVNAQRGNENRFKISPYDSSYRVNEANNGRGNSNGYLVSYYNTGWLVGLCLDMAIRDKTNNKKSLDDVAHNLFKKYGKNRTGFEEDGIRRELVAVGGPSMGELYDNIVMKPGELPVEDALAKVGLRLYQKDETYANLGFRTNFSRDPAGLVVSAPEDWTTLKDGDIIMGINGQMFKDMQPTAAFSAMAPVNTPVAGTVIHLTVQRVGSTEPMQIDVTPKSASRKTWTVDENPQATPQQIALRQSWLTPPAGWVPPQ